MLQLVSRARRAPGLAIRYGWRVWHDRATNAPRACPKCHEPIRMPRNDPGWPDLIMLRDDKLIVIELKAEDGSVTPEQQEALDAFKQVRHILVDVWRPSDLDQIVKVLA